MGSYLIKPYVHGGATFSGQMVWEMPNHEIPLSWKKYINNIDISHKPKFVNKYSGFETTKHKILNYGASGTLVSLNIVLVGDLPYLVADTIRELAAGLSGAGLDVLFYDDLATDAEYIGKWTNAGDFVDNSDLHFGTRIELDCYSMTAI